MPRHARFVIPGIPHHVTQRGNDRQQVFFGRGDRLCYLNLLRQHSMSRNVQVVAYCLMPNHVHLVLIPPDEDDLQAVLKPVHGQYAQRVNRMRTRCGHLWQNRFFSSPLDSRYLLNAVKYVELNPVRAGMSIAAEDYAWSSAAIHCGLATSLIVDAKPRLPELAQIENWSRWLAENMPDPIVRDLRRNASQNLPCGSEDFVSRLERLAGRSLRFRPPGRQPEPLDEKCFQQLSQK
jgi:putative transposase